VDAVSRQPAEAAIAKPMKHVGRHAVSLTIFPSLL